MNKVLVVKTTFIGISAAFLLLVLMDVARAIDPAFKQLNLNHNGVVQEVNQAADGHLWISDNQANEVWAYDTATEVYTKYEGLPGVGDARLDPEGVLWFAAADAYGLGEYTPGTLTATIWSFTTTPVFERNLGIAFDQSGRVWSTDILNPLIYRFDPETQWLCVYDYGYPAGGDEASGSDYIVAYGDSLWLGDGLGARILKVNPGAGTAKEWRLEEGAFPVGMTFDDQGRLWYADKGLLTIGRLDENTNVITSYPVPVPSVSLRIAPDGTEPRRTSGGDVGSDNKFLLDQDGPTSLAWFEGRIWYTFEGGGHIGRLAPIVAHSTSSNLTPESIQVPATCRHLGEGDREIVAVTTSADSGGWVEANAAYTSSYPVDGFSLFYGAGEPWDIAAAEGNVWVTIQQDQKLGWLTYTDCFHLVTRHTGSGSDPLIWPPKSEGCGQGQFLAGESITVTANAADYWAVESWEGTVDDDAQSDINWLTMPAIDTIVSVHYETDVELFLPIVTKD